MMLAAGGPSASTLFFGNTTSDDGATPNVHVIIAPIDTCCGIASSRSPAFDQHSISIMNDKASQKISF
jgi:hypothetical protein